MNEAHVHAPPSEHVVSPALTQSPNPASQPIGASFLASALATLPLPIAWISGLLVAGVLKSSNPDNVDVTQGLAYLRPILVTAFVLFGVVWLAALVVGLARRRAGETLPLKLLALHTAVAVALALSNTFADSATRG